jgi:hypothetical protein
MNLYHILIPLIVKVLVSGHRELEEACKNNQLELSINLTLDAVKTGQKLVIKDEFFYRKVNFFY